MLTLSREKNEWIVFPDIGVKICIVDIRGTKVRIGIEAPKEIQIHRAEVWARIEREGQKGGSHDAGA